MFSKKKEHNIYRILIIIVTYLPTCTVTYKVYNIIGNIISSEYCKTYFIDKNI